MSPRPYQLGRRQEQVDEVRRRVLDAARELLSDVTSFAAFTVDGVAKRADVARATVYYQFESKTGLLEALCDAMALDGGLGNLEAAFREPDPLEALRIVVRCFAAFWDVDRVAMRRLRALARLDAEIAAVVEPRDARRRRIFETLVPAVAPEATLEDSRRLAGVFNALTSFETFDALAGSGEKLAAVVAQVVALVELAAARGASTR